MTRKDYEVIASVIRHGAWNSYHVLSGESARNAFATTMARALAADNPRFDAERFLDACLP